jgi:hypothetical protein
MVSPLVGGIPAILLPRLHPGKSLLMIIIGSSQMMDRNKEMTGKMYTHAIIPENLVFSARFII